MLKATAVGCKPTPPLEWRKANILARIRRRRVTEIEQEEQCGLEAMLHWRDPVERLRARRRQAHTLVEDNPTSG